MACGHLWEPLKLAFPRKSKLPLVKWQLSCQHHVNNFMPVKALVITLRHVYRITIIHA